MPKFPNKEDTDWIINHQRREGLEITDPVKIVRAKKQLSAAVKEGALGYLCQDAGEVMVCQFLCPEEFRDRNIGQHHLIPPFPYLTQDVEIVTLN